MKEEEEESQKKNIIKKIKEKEQIEDLLGSVSSKDLETFYHHLQQARERGDMKITRSIIIAATL
jgi:hypothetical protein